MQNKEKKGDAALEAVENEDVKIPDNSLDTGSILLPPSLLDQ